jgi:hypothetical protein
LRAEAAAMRTVVKMIPDARQEALMKSRPLDTTDTLGAIVMRLDIVGSFIGVDRAAPRDPHDTGAAPNR